MSNSEKRQVKPRETNGEYERKFASMFSEQDLANLKRLTVQRKDRNSSNSFTSYTKGRIKNYLLSPQTNIDNIRAVSDWLYIVSMPYKKIIEYFASMLTYDYNLVYKSDLTKEIDTQKMLKEFQDLAKRLDLYAFKDEMPNIFVDYLKHGAYFGFLYEDDESAFIHKLEPKYCRINRIEDGVYGFAFDATFFSINNNEEFIEDYDECFQKGYKDYVDYGSDYRWFELPMEKTICIASQNPLLPLPYFLPIFISLLDLIDYENLIKEKTELEATVLLYQKIPLIANTQEVNDFAVDLDLVEAMDSMLASASPSLTATAYSPCSIDIVRFDGNDTSDTDILNKSISNLFSQIGVSEMLFNSDKGGSVGLKHSIEVDETLAFRFLTKVERWLQYHIKVNFTEDFCVKFHRDTRFSKDSYVTSIQNLATVGVPVKMDLATAAGYTPYEVMQATAMENALNLQELWKPLNSAYQSSSTSATVTEDGTITQTGAPEKNPDDLTEEGLATKDGNKDGNDE